MQRLDLNLATHPFRNNTLLWTAYVVGFLLVAAFTWWNVADYRDYGGRLADLQESVSTIDERTKELRQRQEEAQRKTALVDLKKLEVRSAKARDILEWKSFSWTRFLNLLEELQPYDVKLTTLRPSFYASTRRMAEQDEDLEDAVPVTVDGEALETKHFLELQRSLMRDKHFAYVNPTSTNKREGGGGLQFQVRFMYFPGGADTATEVTLEPLVEGSNPRDYRIRAEEERREIERLEAEAANSKGQASAAPDPTRRGG